MGVAVEELPPGKQSCPAHYHFLEEEHIIALDGEATLRLGEETYPIRAGDYVCFPAGQAAAHCLINESEAPFRFLIIGERNPHDVIHYPDSGKVSVRLLSKLFRHADVLDYWAGEDGAPAVEAGP